MSERLARRVVPSHLMYLRDANLVEERQGGVRLFPHTDQLPAVFAAIQAEFRAGVSSRIANTDHRADDRRKSVLSDLMTLFCGMFDTVTEDSLLVFPYYSREGVAMLSVAQQVRQSTRGGIQHSFRFFSGRDFLPSIFLSGKRVAFASHLLDRFQQRVMGGTYRNISELFWKLFNFPGFILRPNGHGEALVIPMGLNSLLAFTYEETAEECLFTTCLTVNELGDLAPIDPPRRLYFHYGEAFTPPTTPWATEKGIRIGVQACMNAWNTKEPSESHLGFVAAEKMRCSTPIRKASYWQATAKRAEKEYREAWPGDGKWVFGEGVYGPCMRIERG